jgi:predicted DNA-binding transcriptional regulator AlpA
MSVEEDGEWKDGPLLVKLREAARRLSLSERTVWGLGRSGILPTRRIGRSVRFTVEGLRTFANGNGAKHGDN